MENSPHHRHYYVFWLTLFIILGLFVYAINDILLPFVISIIIAYLLDPLADHFEKIKIPRTVAALTITSIFFLLLTGLIMWLAPKLSEQVTTLIQNSPHYLELIKEKTLPSIKTTLDKISPEISAHMTDGLSNVSSYILSFMLELLQNIWSSGMALFSLVSFIFITPFVTFYMLRDWDGFLAKVDSLLPPLYAPTIREQSKIISVTISAYLRGQIHICLILAAIYATGLTLIGLDFGLFIGIATGILAFIPYVGMALGFTVGLILAFLQFGDMAHMLMVAGVFILGQVLEGNFITPNLIGKKVGLHPVWIIFGLLAGGSLFGFLGVLLAVPVTAIIGVLIRFAISQYLKSKFYHSKSTRKKSTTKT